MSLQASALVLLWLLVLVLTCVVVAIARELQRLRLQPGSSGGPAGRTVSPALAADLPGRSTPRVVLFLSTGCSTCERLLPVLDEIAGEYARRGREATFLTVYEESPSLTPLAHVRAVGHQRALFEELAVTTTPTVTVWTVDGTIEIARPVGSPSLLSAAIDPLQTTV